MASNIAIESERNGGVRQPVFNEAGQSNPNNQDLKNQPNQSNSEKIDEPKLPSIVDGSQNGKNQAAPLYGNPPFYGNPQASYYGNSSQKLRHNTNYGNQQSRRSRKKRKNRSRYPKSYPQSYPDYNQYAGYTQSYAGYGQCYPGYTQSYPGYAQSYPAYPQAQSYPASPQLSVVKNRRKRPFDIIYASNPTPTASEESHLAGHTKQRRKYPKVCGDRTSNRKYDEKSHKRFAITSKRGMKSISQTEEKSIPMLEVIAPYRKCERDRYKKSFEDIEENADWSEADVYVEVADKLLTNRYLEEERKFLERSRKSEEKTKNKWEQLLKSTKKEDDLSPETIAAVIFSEEKGLSLKTVPEVTYQKLFPEDKFTPVVKVVKAGQDKKNAMIPVSLSPADGFLGDEDGAFFESYMKNEFEIPESMPTQVGSRTSQILSGTPNENKDFDIPLEPSVPSRENFVQLRGSVPPKWFPGYIFALPNSSDTIRVDQPYQVFEQGWRAFSPTKSSTPEGIIVVGN